MTDGAPTGYWRVYILQFFYMRFTMGRPAAAGPASSQQPDCKLHSPNVRMWLGPAFQFSDLPVACFCLLFCPAENANVYNTVTYLRLICVRGYSTRPLLSQLLVIDNL